MRSKGAGIDVRGAIELLVDIEALIEQMVLDERRSILRTVFSHLWVEKHDLKTITLKGVCFPLFGVHNIVRMGWLMGLEHPFRTTADIPAVPIWTAHQTPLVMQHSRR